VTDPLDVEYVELRSRGTRETVREVNRALNSIERDVSQTTREIENDFEQALDQIFAEFGGLDAEVKKTFNKIEREARGAGVAIAEDIGVGAEVAKQAVDDLADEATRDLNRIDRAARRAGSSILRNIGLASILARALRAAFTGSLLLSGVGAIGGGIAALLAGITSAAAGLLPVISSLASALVTASGVFIALPGVIATFIGVIATVKIATKGMGDAFQAVASGDAAALDESLKKLAPTARAFVLEVKKLKPAFDSIGLAVQNAFFAGLAKSLDNLASAIFPSLRLGLVEIAKSINGVLNEALNVFGAKARNPMLLRNILLDIANIIARLADALGPVIQALLDAAAVGSRVIAELSAGFAGGLAEFAGRISKLAENGQLRQMLLDALTVMGQFFDLAKNVFGIIKGIFTAAGTTQGGGIFAFFTRLNELINSVAGQEALTTFFAELARIGQALVPVLMSVLRAIGPVARGIADIAVAAAPTLIIFFDALGTALASLAPAFIALGPSVASLATLLQPLATIISDLVVALAPGVAAFLDGLGAGLSALAPVATIVGQALGGLLTAIAPLLPVIGTALAGALGILADLLIAVTTEFGPLIKVLSQALVAGLQPLIPVLAQLITELLPTLIKFGLDLATAFAPLAPVLTQIGQSIATELLAHLPEFIALMQQFAPLLVQIAQVAGKAFLDFLIALAPHIPELVRSSLQLIVALNGFLVALTPLLPQIVQLSALILNLLTSPAGMQVLIGTIRALTFALQIVNATVNGVVFVIRTFEQAIGAVVGAVKNAINGIRSSFSSLPGVISRAVGDLGNVLFNAGKTVIDGLIAGFKAKLGALGSVLGDVSNFIRAHKGPEDRDLKLLVPAGQAIMTGLGEGIEGGLPGIRRLLDGLTTSIGLTAVGAGLPGVSPAPTGNSGVTVQAGAVQVTFTGVVPTEAEARRVGATVGDELARQLASRDVTTRGRTI